MNTAIIFCFFAFAIGASQTDAGGKYCRMKWKCHNVVVHKCNWRIQNVCRNNCRRVNAKVAEHMAARLGVAGALHYHRGLQSVHVGAVRGQGVGRKVLVRGGHGKFGHSLHHYHWGLHGKFGHGHGHHYWGNVHSMILDMDIMGNMDMAHITENTDMPYIMENMDMAMDTLLDMAMENTDQAMDTMGDMAMENLD